MPARLGQHFLRDTTVRDAIVAAARLSPSDRVLEIGPGRGVLTGALCRTAGEVVAVELDERLAESLPERLERPANLKLVREDFLKLDLATLGPGPFVVVSNLPYSVASPILQKLLDWPAWTSAVLMFQKEVALRVVAAPGSADYGLLRLSVWLKADAEWVIEVPRNAFTPPPQVASGVVRLKRLPAPRGDERSLFRVAKPAFAQRRKMAAGVLCRGLGVERERVESFLEACGASRDARPEAIPPEAWLKLAAQLG